MNDVYVALDFPTWEISKRFLEENNLKNVAVKVGMELFYREGAYVIEQLKLRNHPIFLDLKLHDIPTTVKKAMANLAEFEIDLVNVHALGGAEMIAAAKAGLADKSPNTKLIAVTILTSMNEAAMQNQLRLPGSVAENAIHFAHLAQKSGADGVVCSVHEAEAIKAKCGQSFLTVTPGIRLEDSAKDDQVRIATPFEARKKQADRIVVGRSITKASHPLTAYQRVIKEWENAAKN